MQLHTTPPSWNTGIVRIARGELRERFPLSDSRWIGVAEAAHMRPDEAVLGWESGAGAWALPWTIMLRPHLANLLLGEQAILVSLCPICSGAAAFDPVIDGRRHTFRLEGACNGSILAFDYETESLWAGLTGEAIAGPMKGRVMKRKLLLQCTWQEWAGLHPATLVADTRGVLNVPASYRLWPGSPVIPADLRKTLRHLDQRLPHYELVLGVLVGSHSRCYPLGALGKSRRALNDELGGEDIVVLRRPASWMAAAYRRSIDGRTLTFRTESGAIVDEQTGSRWEVSGQALTGPLQGRRLEYLNSGVQEFYAWAAFHPDSGIFGYASDRKHSGWNLEMLSTLSQIVLGERMQAPPRGSREWWHLGMRLLDMGCGDGAISAWFAEKGLDVLSVDPSPERVARARQSFRGTASLKFEVLNILEPGAIGGQFDALIDHGVLRKLPATQRPAYLSRVAAVSGPGTRFLLVLPLRGKDHQQFVGNIKQLFQPSFDPIDVRPVPMPHPETGVPVQGVAFRFVRR